MIEAVSTEQAIHTRKLNRSKLHWRTDYIGHRVKEVTDGPQAELVEMSPQEVIRPHFHQVDQFQVMVDGSGSIGRNEVRMIAVHYADRHTAYGPITAGPFGLSFVTLRSKSDPGAIMLHKPEHTFFLKPSKKRYLITDDVHLSTASVLKARTEVALENVLEKTDHDDGLAASMLRLGSGMVTQGPSPKFGGGQVYLVVNGSLLFNEAGYTPWAVVYLTPNEAPLEVQAGPNGLEALVLNFPQLDA